MPLPLSEQRAQFEAAGQESDRLLYPLSIEEGPRIYAALYQAWGHQLRQSEPVFRPLRAQYLEELQSRLLKLETQKGASMEHLFQALVTMQKRLEDAGIPSAIIGGIAVSIWGNPRLTRDVDIKVLLKREDAERLLQLLTPDYIPLHPEPAAALRRTGFLFFHDAQNTRLDLLLAETSFDEAAIRRAQKAELAPGFSAYVCSAEDLLVYKLLSNRPVDYADAEGIIARQGDSLDDAYIIDWLRQFEQALDDSTLVQTYEKMRQKRH